MREVVAALVFVALAAVVVASASFAGTGANSVQEISLTAGGVSRAYLLHVPPGRDETSPLPLVVALHGGGGSMDHMARDRLYGLLSKADEAGFIVAFPNGYSRFPGGKFATWNAGNCCAAARDTGSDDVGFIRAIVADIAERTPINKGRVYAIGMSNGAMMAYRLACEASDVFSGIMAVAGTDNTVNCSPTRAVSILHVHAKDDDHVLFNGGAGLTFRDPGKVTDFTSVPATISKWSKLNHCKGTPQRSLNVSGATCDVYSQCADGTVVQLCATDTGGHSWPGGRKPWGSTKPSQALRANDVMWEFFAR